MADNEDVDLALTPGSKGGKTSGKSESVSSLCSGHDGGGETTGDGEPLSRLVDKSSTRDGQMKSALGSSIASRLWYWVLRSFWIIALALILSFLFGWLVANFQSRAVFVRAETTRLEITFHERSAPLILRNALRCIPRKVVGRPSKEKIISNCNSATSIPVGPGDRLPNSDEIRFDDKVGEGAAPKGKHPATYVLNPGVGTRVGFEVIDQYAEISVLSLPQNYSGELILGERFIFSLENLDRLGRYQVRGELTLGTPPGSTSRGFLTTGHITIKAPSLISLSDADAPYLQLREEDIPMGGYVSFTNHYPFAPTSEAEMQIQLIGVIERDSTDVITGRFDVQTVNVPGATVPIVQYVGTKRIQILPFWTDVLLKEPFFLLLAGLGTIAGLISLIRGIILEKLSEKSSLNRSV